MKSNPGVEALRELVHMGYRFTVNGEAIKSKYDGPSKPDPGQVRPLLALVRENKEEAIGFLAQTPQAPERRLTCYECCHFRPAESQNPTQAWGYCRKRNKGRYGVARACEAVLELTNK